MGCWKTSSEYISWFKRFECISTTFLTMSRLSKILYRLRGCRNSSEYSKTAGNFLPLLMIWLVQKIAWEIFNIISSNAHFLIFNLGLWCCCSMGYLNWRRGSHCCPMMTPKYPKSYKKQKTCVTSPYNEDVQCKFLSKSGSKWRQEIARL